MSLSVNNSKVDTVYLKFYENSINAYKWTIMWEAVQVQQFLKNCTCQLPFSGYPLKSNTGAVCSNLNALTP